MTIMGTLKRLLICLLCLALCLGLSAAVLAADNTGSDIRLLKVEGTVTVCSSSGKTYSTREDMRLYNGYVVATSAASYAWITLDGTKVAKLDANSSLELRRSGKELELLLRSGKVYFNVSEPLKEEEKLNIRTSTMVTGVRGTTGWVECMKVTGIDEATSAVTILEGVVLCTVTDPASGETMQVRISAGEMGTFGSEFQEEGQPEAIVQRTSLEEMPGFVMMELAQNEELRRQVEDVTELDLDWVTPERAREQLAKEAQAQADDQQIRETGQEEREMLADPVWVGEKRSPFFTVTWVIDGIAETETYSAGSDPIHAEPSKEGYIFKGWKPEPATVTEDATYEAVFEEAEPEPEEPQPQPVSRTYIVTWEDGDGVILKKEWVEENTTPSYTGATPEKSGTAQYVYTFLSWTPEIKPATRDVTYRATFNRELRQYTVTFKSEDGTELQSGSVAYGETPAYTGAQPTKAADDQYTYTFTGWDQAIAAVTGDATYTATFTETLRSYTVTFLNEDGTELQSGSVAYGETPVYSGAQPTKAGDAQHTYTFAGWSPAITAVTGDATYTATFGEASAEYTVIFKNEDGTELQSGSVAYGETPVYSGATPTKGATAQYTYTFAGWTPVIEAVTGDATYTATYTETLRSYTVTFNDEDGTELQSGSVAYGDTPVYTEAEPTKTATTQYSYAFAGWDQAITAVTGDATYTAVYERLCNVNVVVPEGVASVTVGGETLSADGTLTVPENSNPAISYTLASGYMEGPNTRLTVDGDILAEGETASAGGNYNIQGGETVTVTGLYKYVTSLDGLTMNAVLDTAVDVSANYTLEHSLYITAQGSLRTYGGINFTISDGCLITNYGTITIGADDSIYNYGTINNYGTFENNGALYNYSSNTINNYLTLFNAGHIYNGETNTYNGVINNAAGAKLLNPEGGSINIGVGSSLTNNGLIYKGAFEDENTNGSGYVNNGTEAADGGECGNGTLLWWYMTSASGGGYDLIIDGTGAMADYDNNGGNITSPWANYLDALSSVTVEDGVTKIGSYAFMGGAFTTMQLTDDVTQIGDCAFQDCTGLTELDLPEGLEEIGGYAFSGCTGLTSLSLPDNLVTLGSNSFNGCTGLESVSVPGGIAELGHHAFADCNGLTDVNLGAGLTAIGEYMFYQCPFLISISIPDSVEAIGNSAFSYSGLTEVDIPGSVKIIEAFAFNSCTSLETLTISSGVETIAESAFVGCEGLTKVTIPNSVTDIGAQAFYGLNLTQVTVGSGVTSWGSDVFAGNTHLTSVTFTDGLAAIGAYAFEDCSSLNGLSIPGSVTTIGSLAFRNCTSLSALSIPNTVTAIGDSAFEGCTALEELSLGTGLQTIGASAFAGCSAITPPTSNGLFFYSAITSIGSEAFSQCTGLNQLVFVQTVGEIAHDAFNGCTGLTIVEFDGKVSIFGDKAFYGCTNLYQAIFESDPPDSFGTEVFDGTAGNFKIVYDSGNTEWTTAVGNTGTWNGYTAEG